MGISMDDMEMTKLTAQVVEAFASGNRLGAVDLPGLIAMVHQSLASAGSPPPEAPEDVKKLSPAQIRKSIQPDHLVSFEDGRSYKALKRHLTIRGLAPAQYRQKWGLPPDYPMTAASYSQARSALAKSFGFGRKSAALAEPTPPAPVAAQAPELEPKAKRRLT
jgi:predicted transcriptional regulator